MPIEFGNVWVVMRREFLERVRKKSFLIWTILTPLLFGALMILPGLLMMKGEKVATVSLIDKTGWAGPLLEEKQPPAEQSPAKGEKKPAAPGRFVPAAQGATFETEKARLLAKEIDGVLVLEPDKEADLKASFYGQNLGNIALQEFMERRLNRVALRHRLELKGLDPALAAELQKNVQMSAVKVEKGGATKSGSFIGEYIKALMFVMLLYTLIVMYGWTLMRGVMEEKTGKIVEVVVSSMRPFELLSGKILGIASVGLVQYGIWFLIGLGLYVANPMDFKTHAGSALVKPSELILLVVFYVLGFFFYAAIYAAAGSVCTTDQEAQQIQMPVVMCLILPIMLMGLILRNPDAPWLVALSFVPFFAPTLTVMRASLVDVPLWQILGSMLSLVLGFVVVAYLGARIFRVGILMTGKRPTVPEIFRWVRQR